MTMRRMRMCLGFGERGVGFCDWLVEKGRNVGD